MCPSPRWAVTAAINSSRVSTAPSSALRAASRSTSICFVVIPKYRCQLGRSQDRPDAINDRNAPPSSGVSRWSVPRMAQVLMSRPSARARPTSPGDNVWRRTRTASSADEATWA